MILISKFDYAWFTSVEKFIDNVNISAIDKALTQLQLSIGTSQQPHQLTFQITTAIISVIDNAISAATELWSMLSYETVLMDYTFLSKLIKNNMGTQLLLSLHLPTFINMSSINQNQALTTNEIQNTIFNNSSLYAQSNGNELFLTFEVPIINAQYEMLSISPIHFFYDHTSYMIRIKTFEALVNTSHTFQLDNLHQCEPIHTNAHKCKHNNLQTITNTCKQALIRNTSVATYCPIEKTSAPSKYRTGYNKQIEVSTSHESILLLSIQTEHYNITPIILISYEPPKEQFTQIPNTPSSNMGSKIILILLATLVISIFFYLKQILNFLNKYQRNTSETTNTDLSISSDYNILEHLETPITFTFPEINTNKYDYPPHPRRTSRNISILSTQHADKNTYLSLQHIPIIPQDLDIDNIYVSMHNIPTTVRKEKIYASITSIPSEIQRNNNHPSTNSVRLWSNHILTDNTLPTKNETPSTSYQKEQ